MAVQPPALTGVDPPPPETRAAVAALAAGLDAAIPAKVVDRNLLIGTWNVQALSRVTKRWSGSAGPRSANHAASSVSSHARGVTRRVESSATTKRGTLAKCLRVA